MELGLMQAVYVVKWKKVSWEKDEGGAKNGYIGALYLEWKGENASLWRR